MSRVQLAAVLILWGLIGAARAAGAAENLDPATAKASEKGDTLFYDIRALGLEGQGWADVKAPFDRLPAKAEGVVRPPVWGLSRHSAGMAVRFATEAPTISARWTLTSATLAMPHMPATGVSGLDLYVKTDDGKWRWLANGRPAAQTNTAVLASGLPAGRREYLLYLPLYNGVSSVELGVPKGVALSKADARPADKNRAIVFYGTSITHGGCASRPGMCHPAILGRRLERPVINLGFSGNGTMDAEVGALLGELDPAVYVIDCLPNMNGKSVGERTEKLVQAIRKSRPTTPILLVEDRTFTNAFISAAKQAHHKESRAALRKAYDALVAAGDKNLTYMTGDKLLGEDGEDTVDGSHPTDLGFLRHADAMQPVIEPLLGKR
jgi:lysophospholipase L1-like esterase